ncbi:biotin synthase [Alkalispirochaeta sphaeroplastigenens]|uniref:Biotin synthase n=1 Tax=Alkalispirochaeta sphaeroplastigenens TaxID=1187066 RepID=A0A2S4JF82_9SPIO|nr:biotin synthase BioB [Alkalispirochaeta sphaeroplastigenens]POQ98159.1 biotin synthase [Alkalispirochaeta sphaeroplastigenens]
MKPLIEAEQVVSGKSVDDDFLLWILEAEPDRLAEILAGTDLIRRRYFGRTLRLCAIDNGKSGRCSEDCSFCSQSLHATCTIEEYPLRREDQLLRGALAATELPLDRYSVVTSGKGLEGDDLERVIRAFETFPRGSLSWCASLGILPEPALRRLKQAGVSRYHHNLETAESLFPSLCSTHTYQERLDTLRSAQRAGLEICCGGIFGLGESNEQILELAKTLKNLEVDAVPVNFLVPLDGTAAESAPPLSPLACLRILAALRFCMPRTPLIVCGGRRQNLASLEALIFSAGATGLMTGNYLTTPGMEVQRDLAMIAQGGWEAVSG